MKMFYNTIFISFCLQIKTQNFHNVPADFDVEAADAFDAIIKHPNTAVEYVLLLQPTSQRSTVSVHQEKLII